MDENQKNIAYQAPRQLIVINYSESLRTTDNVAIKIKFHDRQTAWSQYMSIWSNLC